MSTYKTRKLAENPFAVNSGVNVSRWLLLVALVATTKLPTRVSAYLAADQSLSSSSTHLQQPEELEPANKEKPFASLSSLAVIDGNVSLVCDISPPNNDDSVALILWYKDDSSSPIYTVDARKASSLEKARTSISEPYANRAHFNGRAKPARLELNNVRLEDEGEFRCRVDFKKGRSINTIISLRLVIPPEEVLIVRSSQHKQHTRLEGLIGPFDEGEPLALVCLAKGGKPRPQITWRRDFNVIDDTQQHLDKEGISNELKIPALSKTHLLSIFTCQVSNSNLTNPLQASITVDLNLKPQEVTLRQVGSGEPLVANQAATFECTSHGSRPQATLHWMFRNKRIDTETTMEQQQSSTRLTITMERSFNQLPLSCVAENPRMSHGTPVEQIIKLDVHYPPQANVELVKPENGSQLQEGIDVYLSCQLEANPRPVKPIVWRFNGKALSLAADSSQHFVMSNQSLVLRKIARHQAGAYTCEATNLHGTALSSAVQLDIKHAPACAMDDILVYEIGPGQSVQLQCGVLANPSHSVHYSWFLADGERNLTDWIQRPEALDVQVDESSSRLKLKPKRPGALIKCKAKNEIGLQQRACLFQVVEAREPQLKHSCGLVQGAATADSLRVDCKLTGEQQQQLKSREDELLGGSSDASSVLGNWINLGSHIKHQTSTGDLKSVSLQSQLVHPPDWMLVELHRNPQSTQLVGSSSENSGEWQLFAYVIVGGSQQQLVLIKSLVEENRLLSSAPKLVYYVAARGSEVAPEDKEARTSYRLLVYGQNLANRTRDWISLRGVTSEFDSERPLAASSGVGSSHHKKSIVPGSDSLATISNSVHDLDLDKYSPAIPSAFAPEQINKVEPNSADETAGLLASQLSILSRRVKQTMAHFSDQAISYARQRPLYAIPAFAVILVSTLFLLGWTGGRLSQALGRGCGGRGTARRGSSDYKKSRHRNAPDSPPMKQGPGSPDSQHQNSPPAEAMSNSNSTTSQETPPYHYHNYMQQDQHNYSPSTKYEKHNQIMNCSPDDVPAIKNLKETVYTIGRSPDPCQPHQTQILAHKSANGYLTGSLDRCHQKQAPIYLTSHGPTSFHVASASAQVTQPQQTHLRDSKRLDLGNSYAYNSGSLSSTDCSSGLHNGLFTCRRSARVSFDLSNQDQSRLPFTVTAPTLQQHQVTHHNRQIDLGQQQHYQIYQETNLAPMSCYGQLRIVSPDQLQQVFQQKGSDSGNTADSGHESPSATTVNTLVDTISLSQHQPVRGQLTQQRPQQQQMLMLMELPNDSSESPRRLLHPLNSFPVEAGIQQMADFAGELNSQSSANHCTRQQVHRVALGAETGQAAIGLPYKACAHQQSTDVSNWL